RQFGRRRAVTPVVSRRAGRVTGCAGADSPEWGWVIAEKFLETAADESRLSNGKWSCRGRLAHPDRIRRSGAPHALLSAGFGAHSEPARRRSGCSHFASAVRRKNDANECASRRPRANLKP